jgi:hypothetical protein
MVILIAGTTTMGGDLARKINRNDKYIFSRGHTVRTGGTIIATIEHSVVPDPNGLLQTDDQ